MKSAVPTNVEAGRTAVKLKLFETGAMAEEEERARKCVVGDLGMGSDESRCARD